MEALVNANEIVSFSHPLRRPAFPVLILIVFAASSFCRSHVGSAALAGGAVFTRQWKGFSFVFKGAPCWHGDGVNTIPYSHGNAIMPEMAVASVPRQHWAAGSLWWTSGATTTSFRRRPSFIRRSLADGESRSVNETSHAIVVTENGAPCLRFQNFSLPEPTFQNCRFRPSQRRSHVNGRRKTPRSPAVCVVV